jgi:hypothetical protein
MLFITWKMSIYKIFTPDEMFHMHSSWLVTHGYLPFKDFFTMVAPTFHFILAPLFVLLPPSSFVLIIARQAMFLISVTCLFFVYKLSRREMSPFFSLAAVLFTGTAIFYMDRMIEVRYDAIPITIYVTVAFLLTFPRRTSLLRYTVTGALIGLAISITQKAIYCLGLVGTLLAFRLLFIENPEPLHRLLVRNFPRPSLKTVGKIMLVFTAGFATVPLLITGYFLVNGILPQAFTFLILYPQRFVSGLAPLWEPPGYNLGFSPAPWHHLHFVYKDSWVWLRETQFLFAVGFCAIPLWLIGLVYVLRRRQVPDLKFRLLLPIAILSGLFSFFAFLMAIDIKVQQYWTPMMPFLGLACTYTIWGLTQIVPKLKLPVQLLVMGILVATILAIYPAQEADLYDSSNNNIRQLYDIDAVLRLTPLNAAGYDAIGSFIYRPDCYYLNLYSPLDTPKELYVDIVEVMKQGKCYFVLKGQINHVGIWYPLEDQYVNTHFVPVPQAPDLQLFTKP